MFENMSFKKYVAVNAAGFGLAGLIWGLILYLRLPNLEYPFHYSFVILLSVFGGVSLAVLGWSIKRVLKSVGAGVLGYVVGAAIGAFYIYYLYYIGIFILALVPFINNPIGVKFFKLIEMKPDIAVGDFWLVFLVIGLFVGLSYSLILKTKIWPMVWRGGVGFALGSLIGPVIGNLIGNAFNSLLIAYLIAFAVMSAVLGKFLAWGIYKFKD